MISSAASTVAPGALLLANSRLASKRPATALLTKSRQQSPRNITFGWWAAHYDRDQQREMRRRHKATRHKCSDAVNKKLLWEQQSGASGEVPRPYRHNVNHYWQSKRSFAFTRHRSAKESSEGKPELWTSALGDMRTFIDKSQASILSKTGLGMPETSPVSASSKKAKDSDYVIDPITNRKISKVSAKSAPDESVGVPPSQLATAPTLDADFPPTISELTAYDDVEIESSAEVSGVDANKKYADLDKYKPVSWNEPDGKPSNSPVELGHEGYDQKEVQKYKPYQWNEPDGKPNDVPVELGYLGYDPAEVQKYQPFMWNEPDGQPTAPPIEVGHHGYDPAEVAKYKPFMWNEPDGKPETLVEQGHHGYDQAEVQQYKPFAYNEPDGKPPAVNVEKGHHGYDLAEVQQYQAFRYNEPDGKPAVATGEIGHHGYDQTEVKQYKAFHYNEPDGKPAAPTGELGYHGYDQSEVQKYRAFRHNEPDGKPAVATGEIGHHGYDQTEVKQYKAFHYNEPDGKPAAAGDSTAASLNEYDAKFSKTSDEAYSKVLRKMASLTTVDKQTKQSKDRASKSLTDAERVQAFADPYSTEPQGLETAYARECGSESAGLPYVKIRRSTGRPSLFDATDPAAPQTVAEPFVYKILAYDPAKQSVKIVETTSTVSDATTPMTPAEVLLRMSSPTKFLPHFESLQAQGFEIASGSGDVMVFRKVRGASADAKASIFTEAGAPAVNPIDMTGKDYVPPSTANFVSPTGYVNLDLPPLYENSPTQRKAASERFQSNIGVRREEPVFSGPKQTVQDISAAKKPGIAKRMAVGATWVAGVSYGLGVASEYLKGL
ncbi:serine-threonine rich protein [Ophiostoma piceae UAMH 11346]|uniref:Serine-threonine rich protein n=1 Tax=Ophiostoma piceae (strain UAMH 11346) TaxID=1262450 RepID=S3C416_OPHP1|nr:serine-threonine rich protein [Ophiostoma piceae UAMH 11346]